MHFTLLYLCYTWFVIPCCTLCWNVSKLNSQREPISMRKLPLSAPGALDAPGAPGPWRMCPLPQCKLLRDTVIGKSENIVNTLIHLRREERKPGFFLASQSGSDALYCKCTCVKNCVYTSSAAQDSGGSFKNRKPIGVVGCCESRMAERIHWWTGGWSCVYWSGYNGCSGYLTTTAGCSCSCSCGCSYSCICSVISVV